MREVEPQKLPTDWINTDIGSFAPLQRGFDLPNRERIDGKYPVVYSNGVMNYHHKYQVKGPGVVTGRSGTIGKVHYVEKNYWPHNTALWVKEFNNAYPKFVYYLYSYIGFERFSSGSGVPTLNRNDAHSFAINVPENKEEQTAIANALSDVDALLTELEKLIAKKQAIKTATMQQLLTGKARLPQFATYTEGEKQGQPKGTKPSELGEIPKDWDIKQLKSILDLKNGYAFKGEHFSENGPIVLTPGNFKLNGGLYFEKRNTKRYEGNYPKGFEFENGDLVVVMTDLTPDCNLLGKPAFVDNEERVLHNQRIAKVTLQSQIWNKKFLYYSLLSPTYLSVIKNGATGSTVRHTSPTTILNAWVIEPTNEEQTAIATILSDMDNEIQPLEQRLAKTRQIKQGMMQELLTGRTRLSFEKEK
ncbi:restriction endonuclease subunit S [Pseudoalteromonas tetraodonis]|uniref:restriction endonuclease subunit S n=1 Tax=Pseudoalteromonas tetraodonis TaxID=43659 RepID=UPI0037351462